MMTPIRVITAGLPPLQEDLVRRTLLAEPDLSVVGAASSAPAMSTLVRWHTADVIVVWARAGPLVSAAVGMLAKHPSLSVVVLAGEGDTLIEARVVGGADDYWSEALTEAVRHAANRVSTVERDRDD
jgi:DNA-binding NarL/FixJ family response regulator